MTVRLPLIGAMLSAAALCAPVAAQAQLRSTVNAPAPVPVSVTAARAIPVEQRRPVGPGALSATTTPGVRGLRGAARNVIYGTIVRLAGNALTIQTRSGALRVVDATPAYAAGTVSAPLYVGKLVAAEGLTRVDGVLAAARISRIARLDHLNADR